MDIEKEKLLVDFDQNGNVYQTHYEITGSEAQNLYRDLVQIAKPKGYLSQVYERALQWVSPSKKKPDFLKSPDEYRLKVEHGRRDITVTLDAPLFGDSGDLRNSFYFTMDKNQQLKSLAITYRSGNRDRILTDPFAKPSRNANMINTERVLTDPASKKILSDIWERTSQTVGDIIPALKQAMKEPSTGTQGASRSIQYL